ncbi:hypothetical protein ACOTTU_21070 [Roseobacter sp. EG26]
MAYDDQPNQAIPLNKISSGPFGPMDPLVENGATSVERLMGYG